MRLARLGVLALAAGALLLAGCSSSGPKRGPTSTATPKPLYADRDLTNDQMASVALALPDFGPRYATFEQTPDSGPQSLTQRALQACQADKEAASLGKYGWSHGYSRGFAPPEADIADTLAVGSYIDVYSDSDQAAAKLRYDQASIRDDTRAPNGCFGYTIEGVDNADAGGVGEQAIALRERFSAAGIRGSAAMLSFRRGRVVVTISIVRLTAEDATAELIALAKKLDDKLQPVLSSPLS